MEKYREFVACGKASFTETSAFKRLTKPLWILTILFGSSSVLLSIDASAGLIVLVMTTIVNIFLTIKFKLLINNNASKDNLYLYLGLFLIVVTLCLFELYYVIIITEVRQMISE